MDKRDVRNPVAFSAAGAGPGLSVAREPVSSGGVAPAGSAAIDAAELIDRYIAMWHEPNPERRREIVTELWTDNGADILRSLDARGYEAIEGRVTRAHEKWVRDGGFVFRMRGTVGHHHNVVKFNWEMVPVGGGEANSLGFDFFILGEDGRIEVLYQFSDPPPPSDEFNQFADRYVALWNEPDAARRRSAIAALWAEDGVYIDPANVDRGHREIEAAVAKAYDEFVAKGFVFRSARNADGHHNTVRFNWEMVPAGGGPVAAVGFDFIVLDDDGRIRSDYQFIEMEPAA